MRVTTLSLCQNCFAEVVHSVCMWENVEAKFFLALSTHEAAIYFWLDCRSRQALEMSECVSE